MSNRRVAKEATLMACGHPTAWGGVRLPDEETGIRKPLKGLLDGLAVQPPRMGLLISLVRLVATPWGIGRLAAH